MPATQDLTFTPAIVLRDRLTAGEISAADLTDACLDRIGALNPRLNAFVTVLADEARAAAADSDARIADGQARPLEGIPVPIKDNLLVAGTHIGMGSGMYIDFPLPLDQELVTRLRGAGAVIIGKTHMPEFGATGDSWSRRFGATLNPWDTAMSAGGSSSGSAVAVASGMVPVAHGNDGAGSLRLPAAVTGLFTLKTSRGMISRAPLVDVTGMVTEGFLTHTVADNAALLDVVLGPAFGDPYPATRPERPFSEEVGADPGRLRIGWSVKPPFPTPVDPECVAAVRATAELCADLGHEVEEHDPDWADETLPALFLDIWSAGIGLNIDTLARFGLDPELTEPHSHALWERSRTINAADYLLKLSSAFDILKRAVESWRTYDVILSPVTAVPSVEVGSLFRDADTDPISPIIPRGAEFCPFTAFCNLTGQPAVSIPLHWVDGFPIGVQAIGRMGEDGRLIRLSAQLEAARPWAHRRPPLV